MNFRYRSFDYGHQHCQETYFLGWLRGCRYRGPRRNFKSDVRCRKALKLRFMHARGNGTEWLRRKRLNRRTLRK